MDRFEREKTLSIYWFNQANDLRGGAGAVWFALKEKKSERANRGKVRDKRRQQLLYPFHFPTRLLDVMWAISRTVVQALIIEIDQQPPPIHNLRKLSERTQLQMCPEDLELIDILTDHIQWAGKYPIPRGGEAEWNQHFTRMDAALNDPVPGKSIRILRPNDRLNWDDDLRIWEQRDTRY